MIQQRLAAIALLSCILVLGCGKDASTPTAPTTSATRVIRLGGSLNFGSVQVGEVRNDGLLQISNDGNAALTITGLAGPCATAYTASWTSGSIAPAQVQNVTIRFAPTAAQSCSGALSVNGDQTSGTNTISVIAVGVAPSAPPPPPPPTCSYTLSPSSLTLGASGSFTKATIQVVTSSACAWTVAADAWLAISPRTGTGNGTLALEAAGNSSGTGRATVLTVGNATTTVTQAGGSSPTPTPTPTPIPSSCNAGPYTWDANPNVLRCRNSSGQFAPSACCGR
jgi:hypothetical protein